MSVLIKDMEMPKSCEDCMLESYCALWVLLKDRPSRHPDCPLIPIPSHGRMIDADALLNLLNNCMFPSDMVTTMAVRMATNWIKEAPTILEAEEGE